MAYIRRPAVAGAFYPGPADELEAAVKGYMAATEAPAGEAVPKAIIAPHAGYIYSGPVAANAYAYLAPAKNRITRVVLLGPCHRVAIDGLALSAAEAFATPLGNIPIDRQAVGLILDMPQVRIFEAAHMDEHSLEVHLPFLQVVLADFSLVPLAVGRASAADVAEVLEELWGAGETLIVVSSDLSHYLSYDEARKLDARTSEAVEALDGDAIGDAQACGRIPMKGLLYQARRRQMSVSTVDLRNSGDTAGPRDQVVGYGAWVFREDG
ncbi:MAG TPA: AmmeMemoRadiSam system protein B [Alphaproteobacteria bacterium]|nr:AmmeMemoRadiSam system protein B [Alphaproteobacteria bacterium]